MKEKMTNEQEALFRVYDFLLKLADEEITPAIVQTEKQPALAVIEPAESSGYLPEVENEISLPRVAYASREYE